MAVDLDDEDDELGAISAASTNAIDEPDDDDRDEDGVDDDDDQDDDDQDEAPVTMSTATTPSGQTAAPQTPPPDTSGNQAATNATPATNTQTTTNAQAATNSQAAGAQSTATAPAAAGATTGTGAPAEETPSNTAEPSAAASAATGTTGGSAGTQNQAAAPTPTTTDDQSAGVRQDVSIEQYIAVAQQNAAKNAVETSEANELRDELNALRASIEERISDARQSFADQLADAQQAIAERQAVAPQQNVEVVQKVVVVQEQAAQPTAPAQIININVDNSVVNNVTVQNNITVIQGGAQQTQVDGTAQNDIVCAAANNAVLTGGAGDDILVAGSTKIHLADLVPLNGSGARGTAVLVQDEDTLTVRVDAGGLEPDQVHIQDINGRFAGDQFSDAGAANAAAASGQPTPIDSVVPPRGADTDGDGFVEYAEQLPYTGPGIMGLASPQGDYANGFPTAGSDGRISFMQAYDLRGDIDPVGFTKADLLPLELRTVVLYGQTVGAEGDGTPGEVNGIPGYKSVLPVAAGEIELISATARVESNVAINATLDGGAGDDILLGKSGNDILRGGAGDDWLTGGGGQNRFDGGDGADAFVLGRGQDLVEDFDFNEGDRLLVAGDQADVNAVIASAVETGTGVRLTTEDNGQITLVGVAAGDVNTEWFTAV
jgi:hypothetical protein